MAAASSAGQTRKAAPEPWYHKLARILGVDRAPIALKGPTPATAGELWVTVPDYGEPRRLTEGTGFSSPVFQPGGRYVFALRGTDLVRVSVAGGAAVKVQSLPGVMKLVGFDEQDADSLLAIFADKAEPMPAAVDIALVSVTTGKRTMVASHQAANTVETDSLLAWERQYGKIQVLPVGHEVVVRGVQSAEIPITNCGEYAVCGQPAYSPELKLVVFVRSGA